MSYQKNDQIKKKKEKKWTGNERLKKLYSLKGITRCEICGSEFILSFHHKHKRRWYKTKPELLHSFDLNKLIFKALRENNNS